MPILGEGKKMPSCGTYGELSLSRICSGKNQTRVKARNRKRAAGYDVRTALNSFCRTRSLDHTVPHHWMFCEEMLRAPLISCLEVVTLKRELKLQVHSKSCGASNSHSLMSCNREQNYTFWTEGDWPNAPFTSWYGLISALETWRYMTHKLERRIFLSYHNTVWKICLSYTYN